jgi:signal transduction histidine kinase
LTVKDNGRGFEPLTIGDQSGLGLANIRERAASIGASLDITSAPDQGTVISIKVLSGETSLQNKEIGQHRTAI